MNFTVPVDQKGIFKKNILIKKKIDQRLDLTGKLKKLWNKKMTVIVIVVSALGMIPEGQEELEIRGKIDTIQTMALLKSGWILI